MEPTVALTDQIDLIEVLLVAFVVFFGFLVLYLRREDKREGYPLEPTSAGRRYPVLGFPAPPPPKTYLLMDGSTTTLPHRIPQAPIEERAPPPMGGALAFGRPPLLAGLGAGAYVLRSESPALTIDGELLLEPLRAASEWSVGRGEMDPRGMRVIGRDFRDVGIVTDLWVDRVARILRYLEVEPIEGARLLVPIYHADISRRERVVTVRALRASQFRYVPRNAAPGIMTPREEDRLTAFYAGGEIYADAGPA